MGPGGLFPGFSVYRWRIKSGAPAINLAGARRWACDILGNAGEANTQLGLHLPGLGLMGKSPKEA
jgi:hypothetical protein